MTFSRPLVSILSTFAFPLLCLMVLPIGAHAEDAPGLDYDVEFEMEVVFEGKGQPASVSAERRAQFEAHLRYEMKSRLQDAIKRAANQAWESVKGGVDAATGKRDPKKKLDKNKERELLDAMPTVKITKLEVGIDDEGDADDVPGDTTGEELTSDVFDGDRDEDGQPDDPVAKRTEKWSKEIVLLETDLPVVKAGGRDDRVVMVADFEVESASESIKRRVNGAVNTAAFSYRYKFSSMARIYDVKLGRETDKAARERILSDLNREWDELEEGFIKSLESSLAQALGTEGKGTVRRNAKDRGVEFAADKPTSQKPPKKKKDWAKLFAPALKNAEKLIKQLEKAVPARQEHATGLKLLDEAVNPDGGDKSAIKKALSALNKASKTFDKELDRLDKTVDDSLRECTTALHAIDEMDIPDDAHTQEVVKEFTQLYSLASSMNQSIMKDQSLIKQASASMDAAKRFLSRKPSKGIWGMFDRFLGHLSSPPPFRSLFGRAKSVLSGLGPIVGEVATIAAKGAKELIVPKDVDEFSVTLKAGVTEFRVAIENMKK